VSVHLNIVFEYTGLTLNTPWYLKANWVLFNIGNAASITVSLLYWTLLYSSKYINTIIYVLLS